MSLHPSRQPPVLSNYGGFWDQNSNLVQTASASADQEFWLRYLNSDNDIPPFNPSDFLNQGEGHNQPTMSSNSLNAPAYGGIPWGPQMGPQSFGPGWIPASDTTSQPLAPGFFSQQFSTSQYGPRSNFGPSSQGSGYDPLTFGSAPEPEPVHRPSEGRTQTVRRYSYSCATCVGHRKGNSCSYGEDPNLCNPCKASGETCRPSLQAEAQRRGSRPQ